MEDDRRNFLKKAILAGLAVETGLLYAGSTYAQDTALHPLKEFSKMSVNEEFWKEVRKSFRIKPNPVYFNNSGLGTSPSGVIDTLIKETIAIEESGNSGHSLRKEYREYISSFLGARPEELCFTRNATEGMNIIANGIGLCKRDEILMTTHEHVGGSMPWVAAANKAKAKIRLVDLDLSGQNNLERIKNAVTKRTKVIVCSHITCTTGMVLPVEALSSWCKEMDIQLCVDGAQAVGMIEVHLNEFTPDYYITSGHKWAFGPKGTGLLYISGRRLNDLAISYVGAYSDLEFNAKEQIFTPGNDASRYEYGTRNTALVAALKAGFEFISEIGPSKIEARGKTLCKYLRERIEGYVDVLTPSNEEYSASILSFHIKGMKYRDIQDTLLKKYGFRVRGIYENNLNAIRISCACYNSKEEIEQLSEAIVEIAG